MINTPLKIVTFSIISILAGEVYELAVFIAPDNRKFKKKHFTGILISLPSVIESFGISL